MEFELENLFADETLWDSQENDEAILSRFNELQFNGIDFTRAKDQGWNTLLHLAAMWNRKTVVEMLIRKGVELNEMNKNGHTPLDLAMHWGHIDLSAQLRHYGGKHTCEKERDIAISQRDLAQEKIKNAEKEMSDAVQNLRKSKQERETLRIERDRLLIIQHELLEERNTYIDKNHLLEEENVLLKHEITTLQLKIARIGDELKYEKDARNNAVQGWKLAERIIEEMRHKEEEFKIREEEALRMRTEAFKERDVARELARLAQLDEGIAKQNQMQAEKERENAMNLLYESHQGLQIKQEAWTKKLAKVEIERKNIQVEIDRQTLKLQTSCLKLEKELASSTIENSNYKMLLDDKNTLITALQQELKTQCTKLEEQTSKLEAIGLELTLLHQERKDDYVKWKEKIKEKLAHAVQKDIRRIIDSTLLIWKKVAELNDRLSSLNPISAPVSQFRPNTTGLEFSREGKPRKLPSLRDTSMEREVSCTVFDCFIDSEVYSHRIKEAMIPLEAYLLSSDHQIKASCAADFVGELAGFLTIFLDTACTFMIRIHHQFRKYYDIQHKMIERKDELIHRFNHHKYEEHIRSPAKFRECQFKPLI